APPILPARCCGVLARKLGAPGRRVRERARAADRRRASGGGNPRRRDRQPAGWIARRRGAALSDGGEWNANPARRDPAWAVRAAHPAAGGGLGAHALDARQWLSPDQSGETGVAPWPSK